MNVSQRELARRARMDPSTVCDIERGKIYPRIDTAQRLADALGVDLGALLGSRVLDVETMPIMQLYARVRREDRATVRAILERFANFLGGNEPRLAFVSA